jgi:hypothetical protein
MANTTNFGWETPDDTDLVKDGAAAMRTLGNSIDASFVDLKGGTTGQVLSKNSNTDLDFTWSSVDPLTILDAKGDLISATAADTPARLAVGTDGQYLQADSTTSTGLKWAAVSSGGYTQLATGTLSGTAVNLTSISQSYNDLKLVIYKPSTASTTGTLRIRVNNITTSSYEYAYIETIGGSGVAASDAQAGIDFNSAIPTAASNRYFELTFPQYTLASTAKLIYFAQADDAAGKSQMGTAFVDTATAVTNISQINIISTGGSFDAGTYVLYGVK